MYSIRTAQVYQNSKSNTCESSSDSTVRKEEKEEEANFCIPCSSCNFPINPEYPVPSFELYFIRKYLAYLRVNKETRSQAITRAKMLLRPKYYANFPWLVGSPSLPPPFPNHICIPSTYSTVAHWEPPVSNPKFHIFLAIPMLTGAIL